jgi:hypothetical protein
VESAGYGVPRPHVLSKVITGMGYVNDRLPCPD